MAEKKTSCTCGCIPKGKKEEKPEVTAKAIKQEKKAQKKSK